MRQHRTIYFNDARHYYLFVFEPPMKLEDAWEPVDECAGTSVDTFIYGVARSDGLFYPSRTGLRFGQDMRPFNQAAYYRVWNNMQSLIDRGLDPLTVLIDRAHEKGMDFIASLRLGQQGGFDPSIDTRKGGRGFLIEKVRDFNFALLKELALDYPTEGVELDYAAPPMGSSFLIREEEARQNASVLTDWTRDVSRMVRSRKGKPGLLGARVYPTEEVNSARGYEVRKWLEEGLLDYVVPMVYAHMLIDSQMPVKWLVELAHANDCSVYPMLGPYYASEARQYHTREWGTPQMMRAAMSNYWDMGADGMYTFFLKWPITDAGRRTLTEMGDVDFIREKDKHYLVGRVTDASKAVGYTTPVLPVVIQVSDTGKPCRIPFIVSDDVDARADRIKEIRLKMSIDNLVADDKITVRLNGKSLENEQCTRDFSSEINAYIGQWLEFTLRGVRPLKGENVLEVVLDQRAKDLGAPLTIQDVEVFVEYHPFASIVNRK